MAVMRFGLALILSSSVAVLAPCGARAQSSSEVAAARTLFQQGLAQARAGAWEEALSSFERSLAIAPRPNTLLNMAGAQTQTGRLVAAVESYRRFLSEATDRSSRRYRPQARQALAELEPQLAHLTLRIDGLADGDVVSLGDQELARAVLGVDLPLDPGEHGLTVTRRGRDVLSETFTVAQGETRELALRVGVNLRVADVDPDDGRISLPNGGFEDSPDGPGGDDTALIIGIVVGLGVAVAAAVVVTTVVLVDQAGQPHQGDFGQGVIEFD